LQDAREGGGVINAHCSSMIQEQIALQENVFERFCIPTATARIMMSNVMFKGL